MTISNGPGDEDQNKSEVMEDLMDQGASWTEAAEAVELTNQEAAEYINPYDQNPEPEIVEYINATDDTCSNSELGLDEEGRRDDD